MNEDQGKTMTLRELSDAVDRGEKIETKFYRGIEWVKWDGIEWGILWMFRIVKPEPKLISHWPVLITFDDGTHYVSSAVFPDVESARRHFGVSLVERLVTEYPAIMLEIKE